MNDNDSLEKALRASLQPVDPGADFTAALRAQLAQQEPTALTARAMPQSMDASAAVSRRARRQH